ncbi:hypothetical protein D3C79_1072480 [compost metagenome]
MNQLKNYYVTGFITIPLCFPVQSENKEKSFEYVTSKLNDVTISVIHADVHTWNKSSFPLVSNDFEIVWSNVLTEDEIKR